MKSVCKSCTSSSSERLVVDPGFSRWRTPTYYFANLFFDKDAFQYDAVAISGGGCLPGGGCLSRGVSAWEHLHKRCLPREDGRCLPRGVFLEGVSA